MDRTASGHGSSRLRRELRESAVKTLILIPSVIRQSGSVGGARLIARPYPYPQIGNLRYFFAARAFW